MNLQSGHGHSADQRLAGLDALRGVAACVVAFGFHPQYMFAEGTFDPNWGGPSGQWLHELGWTAVDLFFVLSGYVFAHVYLPRAKALRSGRGQAEFWLARVARLYPLHLAMLLVAAMAYQAPPANTATAFAAHLVMMQALVAPVGHTFDGPTWSLSVEVVCYVIFALAAWAGRKTLLGVSIAALLIGLGGVVAFSRGGIDLSSAGVISRGLLGFFAGQLLWRLRVPLHRVPSGGLMLAVAASLTLSFAQDPTSFVALVPLTLLAWPALVLLAQRSAILTATPLTWLGDRSYAIYLLHIPIIDLVTHTSGGLRGGSALILAAHLALVVVTLVGADFSYRLFELPMRRAVRRWGARSDAAQPAGGIT